MYTCLIRVKNIKDSKNKKLFYITFIFLIIYFILEFFIFSKGKFTVVNPFLKWSSLVLSFLFFEEVEPDYFYNKFIFLIVTAFFICFFKKTEVLPIFFFLLTTRFFTRSAGVMPTVADYLILCLFSVLGFIFYNYIFTLYIGVSFILDYMHKNARIYSLVFGIFFSLISLMSFFKIYNFTIGSYNIGQTIFVIIIALMYCLRLSFMKNILSLSDNNKFYISANRLKTINFVTTIFVVLFIISYGQISGVVGILSSMFFSAIPFMRDSILENKNKK